MLAPHFEPRYRSLPLSLLWRGHGRGLWLLRVLWVLSTLACVALGLAVVAWQWSGLPLRFGGVDLYLTVYPPLTLCTLWVLCLGLWWGVVPAYLTTLALALHAGMDPAWALLFAFSNPLGFFVLSMAYRAVQLPPLPGRSPASLLFFVTVAFIASVFSATGSFIWTYTGRAPAEAALAIWQGWWLGGFLQTVLLVGPLMALFGPGLLRWRDRHLGSGNEALLARWRLLLASVFSVGGVLVYLWVSFHLSQQAWAARPLPATAEAMRQHLRLVRESTLAVYWIITVLMLSVLFLGYRFFEHWTRELEGARERTARERDLAIARIEEIQRLQTQLREQAIRDPLTGLYNRRHLQQALPIELQRARREAQPLALVVLDLDHFKRINDEHGHSVGDRVLKAAAELMQSQVRSTDFCARFGGEEFCLVLGGANAEQTLERLAALQERFGALALGPDLPAQPGLSFSAGVALYPQDGQSDDALLGNADKALYRAKAQGRRRVCLAGEPLTRSG